MNTTTKVVLVYLAFSCDFLLHLTTVGCHDRVLAPLTSSPVPMMCLGPPAGALFICQKKLKSSWPFCTYCIVKFHFCPLSISGLLKRWVSSNCDRCVERWRQHALRFVRGYDVVLRSARSTCNLSYEQQHLIIWTESSFQTSSARSQAQNALLVSELCSANLGEGWGARAFISVQLRSFYNGVKRDESR